MISRNLMEHLSQIDVKRATHYVLCNVGGSIFVKEANFFREQGGHKEEWGRHWVPVVAKSIGDARRQGARLYDVRLSRLYDDEG